MKTLFKLEATFDNMEDVKSVMDLLYGLPSATDVHYSKVNTVLAASPMKQNALKRRVAQIKNGMRAVPVSSSAQMKSIEKFVASGRTFTVQDVADDSGGSTSNARDLLEVEVSNRKVSKTRVGTTYYYQAVGADLLSVVK